MSRVDAPQSGTAEILRSPLKLPSGVECPNRLVKAAMEEGIGWGGGLPDIRHQRLYRRWGEGGWGMLISGNVQVDPRHLATPHDRCFVDHSPRTVAAFSDLRSAMISGVPDGIPPPLLVAQISHAGIQSSSVECLSRAPWVPAVGPTSTRPDLGSSFLGSVIGRMLWPMTSRRMTEPEEWLQIVDLFVRGAKTIETAGWDGVQIHSAHGYLLASYLSPLTNPDPFPLPGVPDHVPLRLHLLWLILARVHDATDRSFIKSIKINCSDFVQGGLDEAQSEEMIKEIVAWKMVDVLEISGGNYSSPAFATMEGVSARQSLFAHFTRRLLPQLEPPPAGPAILLTGGLHSRAVMADAIHTRAADLIGVGRPACVKPTLPRDIIFNISLPDDQTAIGGYTIPGGDTMKRILGGGISTSGPSTSHGPPAASYVDPSPREETSNSERSPLLGSDPPSRTPNGVASSRDKRKSSGISLVGAGVSTFWHEWQLGRIGRGVEPDMQMHWFWDGVLRETIGWSILGGGPLRWWRTRTAPSK